MKITLKLILAAICIFQSAQLAAQESILKAELKTGSPLLVSMNASQPRQNVILVYRGGLSQIQKNLHGATGILFDLLEEGPKNIPAEQYKKKLYLQNASISFSATPRAFYVSITAPTEHIAAALKLAKETMTSPKLEKKLFDHLKTVSIQQTLAEFENMRTVLNHFAFKDAFQNHPEFMDGQMSAPNKEKISFEDVKAVSKLVFPANHLEVYSSGPMALGQIQESIQTEIVGETDQQYIKINFEKVQPADFKPKGLAITVLNKPAATDNQILFIFPKPFGETLQSRVIGQVSSFLLGGSGSSDLFRILRTERGLTYGASSRIDNNRNYWIVATFGGIKQTKDLITGVPEVVQKFQKKKISKQDVIEAKKMLKVSFRDSLELPEDRLDYLMSLSLNDVDLALVDQYEKLLDAVTPKNVEDFARSKFTTKEGFLYVMGDETVIVPILESLPNKEKTKTPIRKVQLNELQ
ncbi:MAG: M16 family metallopeptidase [Pseudobdellovibrionaceae bacterium]